MQRFTPKMSPTVRPIGNLNKKVFKLLTINIRNVKYENGQKYSYVTCIVPRHSQEQLFRSQPVIILAKFNVIKECAVIRRGFVLNTP